MTPQAEPPRHLAESALIGVHAGRARFACGECYDEVVVLLNSPDSVIDAWQAFVRDHQTCMNDDW
jgi:hypothetical protein